MGSRLRGNDAAVPRPVLYVQQSGTIARTFAPLTGDPYNSLFQRQKWIPAFAGMTQRKTHRLRVTQRVITEKRKARCFCRHFPAWSKFNRRI